MNLFWPLFLMFTVVPVVELWLLITVGSVIGAIPTILLVLGTGAFGAFFAREQGIRTFQRFQEQTARGTMPGDPLFDALLILVGGVLLITPGILTDAAGLMLVFPPTRAVIKGLLAATVARRIRVVVRDGMGGDAPRGNPPHDAPPPRRDRRDDDVIDI